MNDHGSYTPNREVQIRQDWPHERIYIYVLLGRYADGWRLYATNPQGDSPYIMEVAPGEEAPLYLIIGLQEAEAIVEAIRPKQESSARHLDDAIQTRDRLLQMLERQNEAATVRP